MIALYLPLGMLLSWRSLSLFRCYRSERYPGQALASAALGVGSLFLLAISWRVL